MTAAQTKAKRHYWTKIDKRYSSKSKDPEASRQKELLKREKELEMMKRKGAKKTKEPSKGKK